MAYEKLSKKEEKIYNITKEYRVSRDKPISAVVGEFMKNYFNEHPSIKINKKELREQLEVEELLIRAKQSLSPSLSPAKKLPEELQKNLTNCLKQYCAKHPETMPKGLKGLF